MTNIEDLVGEMNVTCNFPHDAPVPATWWYKTTKDVVPACSPHAAQWNGPAVLGPINPQPKEAS